MEKFFKVIGGFAGFLASKGKNPEIIGGVMGSIVPPGKHEIRIAGTEAVLILAVDLTQKPYANAGDSYRSYAGKRRTTGIVQLGGGLSRTHIALTESEMERAGLFGLLADNLSISGAIDMTPIEESAIAAK